MDSRPLGQSAPIEFKLLFASLPFRISLAAPFFRHSHFTWVYSYFFFFLDVNPPPSINDGLAADQSVSMRCCQETFLNQKKKKSIFFRKKEARKKEEVACR